MAENGDDFQQGDHPQDPFGTIAYALTNAQSGDTIHIFPGQYVFDCCPLSPLSNTLFYSRLNAYIKEYGKT